MRAEKFIKLYVGAMLSRLKAEIQMMLKFLAFILLPLVGSEYVEVDTTAGRLLGLKTKTIPHGNRYYSFRGIRYAEIPERFEPSTPKLPWEGVYDATQDRPMCIQVVNKQPTSEDCLFINVYTPSIQTIKYLIERTLPSWVGRENTFFGNRLSRFPKKVFCSPPYITQLPFDGNTSLPVMFWIYGGAFIQGNSQSKTYAPDYFLDEGVVVVTINYRLGIFGFLSTGDVRVPGNNGLKDIILGLQWVQKNIRFFNGDRNKVTIFGESAGAALVSYLTISPLTRKKGYFIRAICESGNALSPWALQRFPKRNYEQVATTSFCHLLQFIGLDLFCLKQINTERIVAIETAVLGMNAVIGINILDGISFSPCYETNSPGAALVGGSYALLKDHSFPPVPTIMGINSEEGIALQGVIPNIRPFFLQADFHHSILVPDDMYATNEDKKKHVAPAIRNYYLDASLVVSTSDNRIIRFISDALFNKPFREFLTLVGNYMPQYCYQFSYVGKPSEKHPEQAFIERVGHVEELPYFWRNFMNITLSQRDLRIKDKVVRLWTNFAKYGNPTPNINDPLLEGVDWTQAFVNGTNVRCLQVDEHLNMIDNPKESGYKMWRNLYQSFGHPKDTY